MRKIEFSERREKNTAAEVQRRMDFKIKRSEFYRNFFCAVPQNRLENSIFLGGKALSFVPMKIGIRWLLRFANVCAFMWQF